MSVESEILRIQHNIANTYAAVSEKGGEVPLQPTSANLAAAVESIPAGGSNFTTDDTLQLSEENILGVTSPVQGVYTSAEYDALSEQQKNKGLYFINEVINTGEWWSPHLTSNNTPTPYVASASSELSASMAAWYAFDGLPATDEHGTGGIWHSVNDDNTQWIQFDFGSKSSVGGLRINPAKATWGWPYPNTFAVLGGYDEDNFVTIMDVTNTQSLVIGSYLTYMFPNAVDYRFYRIVCGENSTSFSHTSSFGDIQFFIVQSENLRIIVNGQEVKAEVSSGGVTMDEVNAAIDAAISGAIEEVYYGTANAETTV